VAGGEIDDDQRLFNAGVSYQFNEQHSVYVNYSQGFELPDYARLLRDGISADSVLNQLVQGVTPISIDDTELEAIEVDSVELGWRYSSPAISAGLALFASESSKTTVFNDDYTVDMLDQDKQISGLEATGQWQLNPQWRVGASLAYTQGETDEAGGSQALPVIEVPPLKSNVYVAWDLQQMGVRLQMQWVDDDTRAQDDNPSQAEVEGYQTFDLLGHYQLPVGRIDAAVHNLANEDYQTVYSQWAEATYGSFAGIAAQGRTMSLGYRVAF
jgi:iron complex outermembrane receptor protein